MYGAILGDMIGSPYEFDMGNKSKEFPLFSERSTFTDDTVMTIAVAEVFLDNDLLMDEAIIRQRLIESMHKYGKLFPDAGYGGRFAMWLFLEGNEPYNSWGKWFCYASFLCSMAVQRFGNGTTYGSPFRSGDA